MSGSPPRRWPQHEAYRYLEHVGSRGIAWEWLRRDPDYRQFAPGPRRTTSSGLTIFDAAPAELQARWPCLHIEHASLPAGRARILWSEAADPTVLRVAASPARAGYPEPFDLKRWSWCAALVCGPWGSEHLLLEEDGCRFRLDIIDGTILCGPVALRYDLGGVANLAPALATLSGFLRLHRTGAFAVGTSPSVTRPGKWIETLRVHDACEQGASIRDIGIMLFGTERVCAGWEAPGEALKSLCRRRIAAAREMATGGWRRLLSSKLCDT